MDAGAGRPTKRVLNVSGATQITEQPDGRLHGRFALFGIEATADDRTQLVSTIMKAVQQRIESDARARTDFQEWASKNTVEVELTEEELQAQQDPKSREAEPQPAVRTLTPATFDKAIGSVRPVLVDFWAPWCKPCLMAAPVIEEIHEELADRMDLAKLNVEDHRGFNERFGIRGIPCFIMFRGGEEIGRIVGFGPKDQMRKRIEAILDSV